jgi:glutamate---cysteine ligase / carboxylate-amine ligase
MTSALRQAFEHDRDLTVAAEEELLLLEPESGDLCGAAAQLLAALGDRDRFRAEISPAQLELVSSVCTTSGEVRSQLAGARAAAVAAAEGHVRLAGLGAHPFARPWSEVGPGYRYAALLDEFQLGIRVGALAAGLHVHVGIAGRERAVAVYGYLRPLMPLLVALTANAPFVGGVDSGLATVRCMLADALPRHGTGPSFGGWPAYERAIEWGVRTGAVADPSTYWWDCRLNARVGTVEVRAPDAQSSLADVEAVIALVHAAARDGCARYDGGERPPMHDVHRIEENRWRAARHGLGAELIDLETGSMAPARRQLSALADRLRGGGHACGGMRPFDHLHRMLERDPPAELRAIAARDGLPAVCEVIADRTELAEPVFA